MAATITLTTAPTVLHRFARTATLATIRMPVRLTDTGGLITSWAVCSLELARGGDGDSVTDFTVTGFTVTADSATDFMMVTDSMVMGSLAAVSMAGRDLEIGQASPTVADSVVDSPAVEVAASQAAAFAAAEEASMGVVASTEVEAVSMVVVVVVVVVDFTAVAADMAVATGN
jgi:hypothetical protein